MGTFGLWYHSWMMSILPEVEQGAVFDQLVFDSGSGSTSGPVSYTHLTLPTKRIV